MTEPFGKKLARKFDEEIRFFKGWMDGPKSVGSILPTSSVTAKRMASVIDTKSGLPVLEIGPGTGPVTKAILAHGVKPSNLYSVEYSPDFASHLRAAYPLVNIIEGDAFDLDTTLGDRKSLVFDSVICAIPLLNFPMEKRVQIIEDLLTRIPAGRPVIQLTYGPKPPAPAGKGRYSVAHYDFVVRNVPPAQLWAYRSLVA